MKTTLFLFTASLLMNVAAISQPTINIGDVTPAFGSSVTGADASYVDPGAAGANQTWDLSGMAPEIVTTSTYLSPAGQPESGSFPGATHTAFAPVEGAGELYGYVAFGNNMIEDMGYHSFGPDYEITLTYPDPRTIAEFPLNYGNSFTDTYQNELANETENGVLLAVETGTIDAQVDGYGTLITPAGTFTDVLRVAYQTESSTNLSFNGIEISSSESTGVEYQYFKAGIPIPVATLRTNVLTSMGIVVDTSQNGGYYMGTGVGFEDKEPMFSSVQLYPMPASTHIELVLDSKAAATFNFVLLSTTGQMVHQWNQQALITGQNQLRFDLPEVATGNYLLQITSPEGKHTEHLVIQK